MTMEEASPHINQSAISAQDYVWCPRERLIMKAKAKAAGMKPAADQKFWLRVLAANSRHIAAAGSLIVNVRQRLPPWDGCPSRAQDEVP